MLEDIQRVIKESDRRKPATEIGKIKALVPYLVVEVNGVEYSSQSFTFYVPAVDRVKQYGPISSTTPGDFSNGSVTVDVSDLELEPDGYERRFLIGDLVSITDRGDSFIIHCRLVPWSRLKTREIYVPTNRQR